MKRLFMVLMFVLGLSFLGLPYLPVRQSDSGSALAATPGQEESAAARDGDDDDDHERDTDDRKGHKHKPKPTHVDSLGPIHFAGRVRALVVRPGDENTIWAATASGGLWVTHDAGSTWSHASDVMRTLAFSSIAIDPQNVDKADIMYAGSGEIHTSLHLLDSSHNPDGTPVEAGFDAGLNLRSPRRGAGIFKTTDGGVHWTELTSTTLNKDFFYVNRIAVQPKTNVVLAATATGLWRSTNGGANWARAVHPGPTFPVPLAGIFLDVKFHSQDASNVVASTFDGQVWFSTDGGSTFNKATVPSSIPTGVPANASTRIELAFVRSQPGVWLAAQFFNKNSGQDPIVVLRSTNSGAIFSVWSNPDVIACGNNRLYSGALFVSDSGSDVFVGGTTLCHSGDFGRIFTQAAESNSMHNDYQSIVRGGATFFGNGTIIIGNDGGIFRILDPTRPGLSFDAAVVNLNNGLVNQQAHGAAINPSGNIVAGFQDIGSLHRATSDGTWTFFGCCDGTGGSDGTTTAGDPIANDLFYFGNSQARLFRSTTSVGGSESIVGATPNPTNDTKKLGTTPILLDHTNPNTLYVGAAQLWRTKNLKTTNPANISWTPIKPANSDFAISAMALAPWDRNVMWVGTLHLASTGVLAAAGQLWMTTKLQDPSVPVLQASWQPITDPMILPPRPVSGVALHPTDQSRVYVSYSGWASPEFTNTSNNLFRGIKGTDGKFHFKDISIGLPGGPVYSVALSPTGRIAAGTEFGARISDDDGATWRLVGARVPIAGFTWIDANNLLIATYGRGLQKATF